MERIGIEAIIRALNAADVRYLVAGGLAVIAHGFVRFTADVDVVLDLEPGNLRRAIPALTSLGYRPRAPVEFEQFADPAERARWASEKGLTVFSLFSPAHPAIEVDLFLEAPFEFESAYARSPRLEVAPGVPASFVALPDLIAMKRKAGRAQDLVDIDRLETLSRPPGSDRPQ